MKRIALIFPGQGSQIIGMGKVFFENFKECKILFEEASDSIHVNLKKLCFEGPLDELTLTENLQPALYVTEMAMLTALRIHLNPAVYLSAGHSLGEYAALSECGALSVADGAKLTRKRGQAMQKAVPQGQGAMAAVIGLSIEEVDSLCKKVADKKELAEPANYNSPGQVVVSGSASGIALAAEIMKADFKTGKFIPLQVSAPFHCSLMKPAQDEMQPMLQATKFSKPTHAYVANCTAGLVKEEKEIAALLIHQIVEPVRWEQSMNAFLSNEIERVIEVGPGKVLAGLMKRINKNLPVENFSDIDQLKALKG